MSQKPSPGRIVHVMIEVEPAPALVLRPAIITRVGPVRVGEVDDGQVAYKVLYAPEDLPRGSRSSRRVGRESPAGGEWKPNDWRWPERV
jgi:hypothetical protein